MENVHKSSSSPIGADSELPAALANRLGFLLGRAHLAHRAVAERNLRSLGLSGKGLGALALVAEEGPLTQRRLGERQGVDRTTVVALVDELEGAGLIERGRRATDRRAYSLQATAKGRKVLSRANEAEQRAEEEFLASISARERTVLKRVLRELLLRNPPAPR